MDLSLQSFYERAISKMQISPTKIRNAMVENIEYPNEFDFITYGAVFEHLYHPAQTLEEYEVVKARWHCSH